MHIFVSVDVDKRPNGSFHYLLLLRAKVHHDIDTVRILLLSAVLDRRMNMIDA
jgi:hypothetical protein